ncbi:MAG: sulfotransferase domain-containing protein [Moorea sp. SIO1F2]|uniref:sulfotransferase domain-containing protein n=1 Tax=Moorena sp. SIO1F2 TaxID=2607819 RepID=UPI0013B76F52|nr:sulfotransferase domain-containing protein [Moorena sp. SIO1F2]NET84712.1 sulfotransferase domain-containing protein [Moorena sp. SIO1F2]
MEKILYTRDNQKVYLDVPPPGAIPSFFVFALHKSGSVMQDKIIEDIGFTLNIPLISVAKTSFNQGVEESAFGKEICDLFVKTGYGFYGSRYLPAYLNDFDLSGFKKILLIRDPRDIVVSHYFSMKNSHVIPPGKVGDVLWKNRQRLQDIDIDEYAIQQAPIFRKIIQRYSKIEDQLFKLFRYEDIVFHKRQWVADIITFLEVELEDSKIEKIAKKHDIFPTKENPALHIRKVTPGDYKEKLQPATIDKLNECFKPILIKYGYEN